METTSTSEVRLLAQLRARSWHWYKSLQPNQRAYFNALALFALYLPFKHFNWEIYKGFAFLAVFFWAMAMLADLISLYKAVVSTLLGKLILVGAFGLGANVAIAGAAQVVNGFIGVDPSQFVHTIAFTSLFVAPPLILLLVIVALVLGAGLIAIFIGFQLIDENARLVMFPWYKEGSTVRYRGITAIVQVASLIVLVSFAHSWYQAGANAYNDFFESKAKWFLYTFEMYKHAQCPLQEGQRVAFLGGDQVLIASKAGDEITFAIQGCVSAVGKP